MYSILVGWINGREYYQPNINTGPTVQSLYSLTVKCPLLRAQAKGLKCQCLDGKQAMLTETELPNSSRKKRLEMYTIMMKKHIKSCPQCN